MIDQKRIGDVNAVPRKDAEIYNETFDGPRGNSLNC